MGICLGTIYIRRILDGLTDITFKIHLNIFDEDEISSFLKLDEDISDLEKIKPDLEWIKLHLHWPMLQFNEIREESIRRGDRVWEILTPLKSKVFINFRDEFMAAIQDEPTVSNIPNGGLPPSKPAMPPKTEKPIGTYIWLDYYHDMKNAGFKMTFKMLAEKSWYGESTLKQSHKQYKLDRKNNKIRTILVLINTA